MRSCLGIGRVGKGAEESRDKVAVSPSLKGDIKKPGVSVMAPAPAPSAPSPAAAGPAGLWTTKAKRLAVTAESSVAAHVPVFEKPSKTKMLIGDAIKDNLLFQDLPQAALEVIIDSMTSITIQPGADVITQGDAKAHEFFVLEEGMCEVWVKGNVSTKAQKVSTYTSGSSFGELALLYNAPRAATIRAATKCHLWVMERSVYNAVKRNFTQELNVARHQLLEKVPGLKQLPAHQRALLVDALKQVEFAAGRAVFLKGTPGNEFFIVKEGKAQVQDGNKVLAELGTGSYFGERALLGAEVRAADVVATTKLVCYCLSRADFNDLLGSADDFWRFEAVQKVPLLYNLSERQMWQLARVMQTETMTKGQVVFKKGEPGDNFYIIQEGIFTCCNEVGKELARICEGSCFGELALLRQETRAATVIAMTDAKVLVLSRDQFQKNLGNLTQLQHVWRFEALRRVPLLCTLEPDVMSKLAGALVSVQFKAGQDIIVEGEVGDKFYIVEYGRLGVYKGREASSNGARDSTSSSITSSSARTRLNDSAASSPVKAAVKAHVSSSVAASPSEKPLLMYEAGNYFGELALIRNEPRAATVRALTNVSLLSVERSHFSALMGPLLPAMIKQAERYLAGAAKSSKEVDLQQIKVLSTLGSGGFGRVLLVQYGREHYALKCIKKSFVLEQGLVEHVKREKEAMLQSDSPFLVKMTGTAQDDSNLYMMMEAVMGGELFGYLQTRTQPLTEAHARFYAASVILGLEYLHDRDQVYRDLKPENLLIDLMGYVKVTDFGFVKKVKKGTKTYTLCGTPEYLAPEIIMNKGHNHAADWWALGVLIFELCSGMPPFMHEDRLVMFRKICSGNDLNIPRTFSKALQSLTEKLLNPNPAFRLGCGKMGANEIKAHPWFNGFDWDAFAAKTLTAPYIPQKPKHDGDAVNFAKHAPVQLQFKGQGGDKGAFVDF